MLCVAVHFFLACSISLYECHNLSILVLMDIWDAFTFYLFPIKETLLSMFLLGICGPYWWGGNGWVAGCVQFSFSRNSPMVFWSDCTDFHLYHQWMRVPIALPPWQHLPLIIMPFLRNKFNYFLPFAEELGEEERRGFCTNLFYIYSCFWDYFSDPAPYRFSICSVLPALDKMTTAV